MWGKKVEFSLQHRWFSFSILIGITVLVYLHQMPAGFGMCLPIDRASHLLIACSPCFRPEMYAFQIWNERFWRQSLPTTGGSLCLLHCLEERSFGCYLEIWNYKQRGGWEIYFFFPAPFLSFLTSVYTLDFHPFWVWVFLLFCFSFIFFCFI